MFVGEKDIQEVIKVLQARRAHLYHACQYKDFLSYLHIGGVPSRAYLVASDAGFTAFQTDQIDQQNETWDKVFLNLSDFGTTFAKGKAAVPNPYGPILLRLTPAALETAADVAVCLRSAGATGFDRLHESLSTPEEIDRLFVNPVNAGYPMSTWVKFAPALRADFDCPSAHDPEISCSVDKGFISFSYVDRCIVDPYSVNGTALTKSVSSDVEASPFDFPVWERISQVGAARYQELANMILEETPPLSGAASWGVSEPLRTWAADILRGGLEYQFIRYAQYLREGTLLSSDSPGEH